MELKYYAGKDVLDALLDCMERISKQDGADVVEVVRARIADFSKRMNAATIGLCRM